MGICGGFQMLGLSIEDSLGVENQGTPILRNGLDLLPVRTVLRRDKTVRHVHGFLRRDLFGVGLLAKVPFEGYEIHVGETWVESGASPLADIFGQANVDSAPDGAIAGSGRVFGTYVHGFFDQDEFRHAFIEAARAGVDLTPATEWAQVAAQRQARIDRLASHLRKSLDMNLVRSWIMDPVMTAGKIGKAQAGLDGTTDA
jgi:adenosylcobyric acid synthase